MNGHIGQSVAEVYQDFILAKTAEGVSDITIRNYHQHLHNISKYLDIEQLLHMTPCWDNFRARNYQRHMDGTLIEVRAFKVNSVIAQHLAMI